MAFRRPFMVWPLHIPSLANVPLLLIIWKCWTSLCSSNMSCSLLPRSLHHSPSAWTTPGLLLTNCGLSFICSQPRPNSSRKTSSNSAVHAWYQQMYSHDTFRCLVLTRCFENVRLLCILSQILKHIRGGILFWYVHYRIPSTQENTWAYSVLQICVKEKMKGGRRRGWEKYTINTISLSHTHITNTQAKLYACMQISCTNFIHKIFKLSTTKYYWLFWGI